MACDGKQEAVNNFEVYAKVGDEAMLRIDNIVSLKLLKL